MSTVWPYGEKYLRQMKFFCDVIIHNQHLLWLPELKFFKDFIEVFGGRLQIPPKKLRTPPKTPESEPESDLEIDTEGCVEPDEVSPDQKMGDPDKEVSDDDREKAIEKRSEALLQISEGNAEKAVELFTEAIELDPTSALLFAKRGLAYLELARPNACIKDCTRALELNPECVQALKYRGRAFRLVGNWWDAMADLRQAEKLDCLDEDTREWMKEVFPRAKRIDEHIVKKARKELRRRGKLHYEKMVKARDEYAKARSAGQTSEEDAIAHAKAAKQFDAFFRDPDFRHAMTDVEVAAAMKDMVGSPGKLDKYKNCPKVMAFVNLMCKRFLESGLTKENLQDFYKWGAFKSVPEVGSEAAAPPPKFQLSDDDDDDNLD